MIQLICIVLFCLGWRMVTDEGQLLYFIKKPFEDNYKRLSGLQEIQHEDFSTSRHDEINQLKRINFFAKPFILCITCMASFWGITVFIGSTWYITGALPGLHDIPFMFWCCICASFIQTFIWKLYELV